VTVRETVDARKTPYRAEALRALFEGAARVVVARGQKAETIPLAGVDWDDLAAKVLGRSGTLRAPAGRVGSTFVVGWSEAAWDEALGSA
jgi:hypothetical protein